MTQRDNSVSCLAMEILLDVLAAVIGISRYASFVLGSSTFFGSFPRF